MNKWLMVMIIMIIIMMKMNENDNSNIINNGEWKLLKMS